MASKKAKQTKKKKAKQAKQQNHKAYAQFMERLKVFEQDLNAVIIENALADGTIKDMNVVRELLNIQPGTNFELMKTQHVPGVGVELVEVFSKVFDGCAAAGKPCEGLDVLKNGVIAMESMARKITVKYGEPFSPHGPLGQLMWLTGVPAEVENYRKMISDVLDSFEKSKDYQNLTDAEAFVERTKLYKLKESLTKPIPFLDQAAAVHGAGSLKQETVESEINKVLILKAISIDLKNDKSREESKEKLKSINKLKDHCASVLSDGSVNPAIRNMHSVVLVNNLRLLTIKERNFTHGFFKGGQDYVEYFDNLNSGSSEKNMLLDSPREPLRNYLVHSSELSKKIKPSLEVFQTGKSLSLAEENIKEVLMEAKTEIEQISEVQKYGSCYQEIHEFDVPNGFDAWENEKTHVQNLGNNGAVLAEKLSKIPKGLPLFEKFVKEFVVKTLSTYELLKKMESYPERNQIIAELETRASQLDNLKPELENVETYSNGTTISNLFPNTATWFVDSGASRILNCLQNETVTTALINAFGNRTKLSLSEMKPDNKHVLDFKEAQVTLGKKANEWNKIKKVFEKRKKNKRSAKNRPKLDDPFVVNRDLSYAVKLFSDLVTADNIGDFLENIMKSEGPIENMLNNLPDRVLRERLKMLFTPEIRKTLKSVSSVIAQVEKKIGKVPSDKEGVSNALKNIKMDGLSDVKIGELTDMLMLAGLPLNQNVTEEIKYTELEFSNGSTKLANGLKAFLLAHTFLSAVLSPEDKAAIDSQDSSGYHFQWWHAVVAVLGAVVITILIRFIYFYAENKGEKNQFEKALTDTFSLKQKKKGIEIVQLPNGEIGVRAESKTSDGRDPDTCKPAVNPAFEKKPKKDPEAEIPKPAPEPKIPVLLKARELKTQQLKDYVEVKKYGEHEHEIRLKTEEVAEKVLTFKFHQTTMEELEVADNIQIEDVPLTEITDGPLKICLRAKINYLCGSGHDLYEVENANASSNEKWRAEMQAELDKTQKCLDDMDMSSSKTARYLGELSGKVLKKSVSKGKQEVSIDTTQESNRDDLPRTSAGADDKYSDGNIDTTIHGRWSHTPRRVMLVLHMNLQPDYVEENRPDPNDDLTETYFDGNIKDDDNNFNKRMMRVCMGRKKVIELDPMKKLDAPDRRKPLISMNNARELIRQATVQASRSPAFLKLNRRKTRLVGDIHGYYPDFLRQINIGERDATTYIMTGDLVGRGERSLDTLFYMITLMLSRPMKYHYIRGNHELQHTNIADGFFDECVNTYGEIDGREIWTLANGFFAELPVACLLNDKIFIAHGGVSHLMRQGRSVFDKIKKRPVTAEEWKLWLDLLWSDPDEHYSLSKLFRNLFPTSKRSKDVNKFSPVALISILEACKLEGVIRAHENRAAQTIVDLDKNSIEFIRFTNQNVSDAIDDLTMAKHKRSRGTGGKKKRSRSKGPSTLMKMEEGVLGKRK
ncbi:hypothetical protein B9Z55_015365 [Caenorhabditis nigoni]|uniref:Serine/threonine-protein phosphatase n=1 Tax=Caenorhabditis nigoni TaxID=1611254 RepID=A0A2G5U9W4_9PELO|nr:hypothetical protein B9Z55_015365 [Caenorhabditis nigoni]